MMKDPPVPHRSQARGGPLQEGRPSSPWQARGGAREGLVQPAGVSIPAPTVALVASSTRMKRPVTRLRV